MTALLPKWNSAIRPLAHSGLLCLTLILASDSEGQTAPAQLKLIAADDSSLQLPNNFGVPTETGIDQARNYVFIGAGGTALFRKAANASSFTRLLQRHDPVPAIAGAKCDLMQNLFVSDAGPFVLTVLFDHPDHAGGSAVFTHDGSTFAKIVTSSDLVPAGGATFGSVTAIGLNSAGAVAFSSTPRDLNGISLNRTELYIVPLGGVPLRVASSGDVAPGLTASTLASIDAISFDNSGRIVFLSGITGGAGGYGVFFASSSTLAKVVAHGDARPAPASGTFSLQGEPSVTKLLWKTSPSGHVFFPETSAAIWRFTPGTGLERIAATGTVVPPPPGDLGGTLNILNLRAVNANGDAVFTSRIVGTSGNGNLSYNGVLFRSVGGTLQSVAHVGQAVPNTTTTFSSTFDSVSVNDAGAVAFRSTFANGGGGLFTRTIGGPLTKVIFASEASPVTGGGFVSLNSTTRTRLLNDGALYHTLGIYEGTADHWEFTHANGQSQGLLSNIDPLPAGATISLRTVDVSTAGDYAGFLARRAGGPQVAFRVQLSTGQFSRVAGEGDQATGAVVGVGPIGGRFRSLATHGFSVSSSGKVSVSPTISGGLVPNAVYVWDPSAGLNKVAAVGDPLTVEPVDDFINSVRSNSGFGGRPMNGLGKVLLSDALAQSLFIAQLGGMGTRVLSPTQPAPGDGTFLLMAAQNAMLNDTGQVAFSASVLGNSGIYLWSPGGGISTIAKAGDASPAGGTFSSISTAFSLNNLGQIFFTALVNGGPNGYFIGTAAGPLQAVAVQGVAAPGGGNFSITNLASDGLMNDAGDVAFRSSLTGGTSDSGYFIRRGSGGALQRILAQGQTAPATVGEFGSVPAGASGINGEFLSLAASGELFLRVPVRANGLRDALYRFRTNNILEKIVMQGEPLPGAGNGVLASFSPHLWPTEGPALWASIVGGTRQDAIYSIAEVSANLAVAVNGPGNAVPTATNVYSVTISNLGPSTATGIVIDLPKPSGSQWMALPSGCSVAEVTHCTVSPLAAGAAASLTLSLRWTSPGQKTVGASVSAAELDPVTANNAASAATSVNDVVFSLVRPSRPARNATSSQTTTVSFEVFGLPVGQRIEVGCRVSGNMLCQPSQVSYAGTVGRFAVRLKAQRARRLQHRTAEELTVWIAIGELRRSLTVRVQ